MLRSYFMIALRNLKQRKTFTLINMLGMALGMAGFTVFAHMSGVKLNADRFHENADHIYGVVQVRPDESGERIHTALLPAPLLPLLQEEFPEIQTGARVRRIGRRVVRRGDESFYESGMLLVDSTFLSLFSFPLKEGNPETALDHPASIVISEAMALKYFGDEDPIGQTLAVGSSTPLTVTGVSRDFPRTSSIRFEFLIPWTSGRFLLEDLDDWNSARSMGFVLLPEGGDAARMEDRLSSRLRSLYPESGVSPERMYLFPFLDFRLKSRHIVSEMNPSHPAYARVPILVGILLLVVVSINFVNLATVRSLHRTREVGLRKVVGARRRQLIVQFMGESVLLAGLAVPIAILFYELIHPVITSSMGVLAEAETTSRLANSIFNYPYLIKYMAAAALLTGLFSGIYPALFLSAARPIRALSGGIRRGRGKRRGGKALIVFQFSVSILFIAFAAIIRQQGAHFLHADLGYSRERVAVVRIPREMEAGSAALRQEILFLPGVETVTAAGNLPLVWENLRPVHPVGSNREQAIEIHAYGVDYGFVETLELRPSIGRGFERSYGDREGLILSRTAAARLGWPNPLGERLKVGDRTGTVIGVVEDFLFADIGFGIPPALLYLEDAPLPFLLVKFAPGVDYSTLRTEIRKRWRAVHPGLPFVSFTLEDYFGRTFRMIDRIAGFLGAVGMAVILFAGMGLLGLASYLVEGRTKEIGIRRVLGAGIPHVAWIIIREFLALILISNLIAQTLIHVGWHKVLQTGLLFMTPIGFEIPLAVAAVSFLAALAAVGGQTFRTARTDPVRSLRCE